MNEFLLLPISHFSRFLEYIFTLITNISNLAPLHSTFLRGSLDVYNHRKLDDTEALAGHEPPTFNILMVLVCISSASMACGLTQGLLSLNPLEMRVKIRSGTLIEKERAARVLPLITEHHLLLVTLMLFNSTANEALPLFLDQLVPSYITIIMSVSLVLLFGEIIPSSFFTGPNQLQIASVLAPFTWFIIFILYPIAYPISKALDAWLGHDDGMTMFNRKEIYTMMKIQQEEAPKRGISEQNAVINEEVLIIGGALNLRDKNVEEVMTRDVFSLSINEKLTIKTLWKIFNSGCSRIPIWELDRNDIVGLILVKDLLFIDPDDEIPIRNFFALFGRPVQAVWPDQKLHEIFKLFRKSHSHMAIVRDVNSDGSGDPFYEVKGIITMEDIFEEIIGEDILDETDETEKMRLKLKGFNPNVDLGQLKHVPLTATINKEQKLSDEEMKSIISFLNSQVPQITELFGENNIPAIQKLVETSKVLYLKDSNDINNVQNSNNNSMTTTVVKNQPLQVFDQDSQKISISLLSDDYINIDNNSITPSNYQAETETEMEIENKTKSMTKMQPIVEETIKSNREYLYKRDKVSNACTLILSGTLKVIAGKEEFEIEKGPWSILAADILLEEDGAYVSDFSAYVTSPEFKCLRILKPESQSVTTDKTDSKLDFRSKIRKRQSNKPKELDEYFVADDMANTNVQKPKRNSDTNIRSRSPDESNAVFNPLQSSSSSSSVAGRPRFSSSDMATSTTGGRGDIKYVRAIVDDYQPVGLRPHINLIHHTTFKNASPVVDKTKLKRKSNISPSSLSPTKPAQQFHYEVISNSETTNPINEVTKNQSNT